MGGYWTLCAEVCFRFNSLCAASSESISLFLPLLLLHRVHCSWHQNTKISKTSLKGQERVGEQLMSVVVQPHNFSLSLSLSKINYFCLYHIQRKISKAKGFTNTSITVLSLET